MIDLITSEICKDIVSGVITEAGLVRMLRSSKMLYPRLLEVEEKVIKDIQVMKKHKGRNEYERYNLTSGTIKAEQGLVDIQEKIIDMENTILAIQGLLGEKMPFILCTSDGPILLYQLSPTRILFEEAKKSRTQ